MQCTHGDSRPSDPARVELVFVEEMYVIPYFFSFGSARLGSTPLPSLSPPLLTFCCKEYVLELYLVLLIYARSGGSVGVGVVRGRRSLCRTRAQVS